tara:strand:- start:563 stop:1261 length:699 start_codon:yes stop_codon:yes gene_type:complete
MLGLTGGITNTSYQWQPNMVGADLKLWLRNGVGVTAAQWDDSSGTTNHATQGTSGNQAAVSEGGLEFTPGNEDHYDIGDAGITCSAQEGFMVFAAIKPDSVDTMTLLGVGGTSEFLEIMSNVKIRLKIDGDTDVITFDPAQFIADEFIVLGVQREAGSTGNINIYKNGTKLTPTAQQANAGEVVFNTLGDGGSRRFFDGHFHEMLVYDTADLTDSEINKINNYLVNKHKHRY